MKDNGTVLALISTVALAVAASAGRRRRGTAARWQGNVDVKRTETRTYSGTIEFDVDVDDDLDFQAREQEATILGHEWVDSYINTMTYDDDLALEDVNYSYDYDMSALNETEGPPPRRRSLRGTRNRGT